MYSVNGIIHIHSTRTTFDRIYAFGACTYKSKTPLRFPLKSLQNYKMYYAYALNKSKNLLILYAALKRVVSRDEYILYISLPYGAHAFLNSFFSLKKIGLFPILYIEKIHLCVCVCVLRILWIVTQRSTPTRNNKVKYVIMCACARALKCLGIN